MRGGISSKQCGKYFYGSISVIWIVDSHIDARKKFKMTQHQSYDPLDKVFIFLVLQASDAEFEFFPPHEIFG